MNQLVSHLACLAVLAAPATSAPQRGNVSVQRTPAAVQSPAGRAAPTPTVPATTVPAPGTSRSAGQRPVILLTGYWPPTNESVRRFSQDPAKNPGGWAGSDWMGSGYDVVSYFPEFANPNCTSCGKGQGDLEVDYQDTVTDFDAITALHRPIAVITFSRGFNDQSWEVESNQFNRRNWIGDFVDPRQPTPAPPDATVDRRALRLTALPAQRIVDDVGASGLGLTPFICYSGSGGGYLSEFIAYLGVWYQARNNDPSLPDWCVAAGHIHVGGQVSWPQASAAVDVTLDTLIDYVDEVRACPSMIPFCPAQPNSVGRGAQLSPLGGASIGLNNLELIVQRVPAGTAGLAFYGPAQTNIPLGNGTRCVGGTLARIPVPGLATADGWMILPLDMSAEPLGLGSMAVTPGSTWNIQVWYRDVGVGAGTNLTNALAITFCP